MSRSGYVDDMDDQWAFIRWRGAVNSAIRGQRGQSFMNELLEALDTVADGRLVSNQFETAEGEVCALGAVGVKRGLDMSKLDLDPENSEAVAQTFGIAPAMAKEIMYMNDEILAKDDQERFKIIRRWVKGNLTPTTNHGEG